MRVRLIKTTRQQDNNKTTTRRQQDDNKTTTRQHKDNIKTTRQQQDNNKTTTRQQQDNNKTTTRQQQDNNKTTTRQQQDNNKTTRHLGTETITRTRKKEKKIGLEIWANQNGFEKKDDGSGKNVSGWCGMISQWVAGYLKKK